MKCLAVNTANAVMSLALVDGEKAVHRFETTETRDQGNLLLRHIRERLAAAGWAFSDLNLLAVVTGPGSFTGIRIGIAAMRGIALASGAPLVGISSFELFAVSKPGFTNIVALESWREELYFQAQGHEPVNLPPESFVKSLGSGPFLLSGDAAEKLKPFLRQAEIAANTADAAVAGRLALARFVESGARVEKPVPFYLREADVTLPGKKGTAA